MVRKKTVVSYSRENVGVDIRDKINFKIIIIAIPEYVYFTSAHSVSKYIMYV